MRYKARAYLIELRQANCPKQSHSSLCSPLTFTEFLATVAKLNLPPPSPQTEFEAVLFTLTTRLSVPSIPRYLPQRRLQKELWCLSLNLSKCKTSFFLIDLYKVYFQSHLLLFNSSLRFNPTPTFLEVTFNRILFFSLEMYLRLRPSSSLVSRSYVVYLCFILQPDGFHFSASRTLLSGQSRHHWLSLLLPYPPLCSQRRTFLF